MTLVGLILHEAYNYEVFVQALREFPYNLGIMMARFLCVIFLHMVMHDELQQGFETMKYAANHPWKFRSWHAAFAIGLAEVGVMLLVQATNMFILI